MYFSCLLSLQQYMDETYSVIFLNNSIDNSFLWPLNHRVTTKQYVDMNGFEKSKCFVVVVVVVVVVVEGTLNAFTVT